MTTTQTDLDPFICQAREVTATAPILLLFTGTALTGRIDLDPTDPVPSMVGLRADDEVSAVALHADATVTSSRHLAEIDHRVIHVSHRSGWAITVMGNGHTLRRFGPTIEPQHGRVPDACRRILGLSTAPPTDSMTDFVVAAWLEVVARRAIDTPSLSWPSIVDLHPTRNSIDHPVTPAALAEATRRLGAALDWERFRKVIASVGGFPFGDDATALAAWMDAGMFSRWAIDALPARADLLDLLASVLGPAAFDRLWATVRLCD